MSGVGVRRGERLPERLPATAISRPRADLTMVDQAANRALGRGLKKKKRKKKKKKKLILEEKKEEEEEVDLLLRANGGGLGRACRGGARTFWPRSGSVQHLPEGSCQPGRGC